MKDFVVITFIDSFKSMREIEILNLIVPKILLINI